MDKFKSHGGSAFHGVFIAAGRVEAAVTAERDKFEFSTVRAAERGLTTVNHFIHIFYDRLT